MRWKIGSKNLISIAKDPWIPREGNFKPMVVREDFRERKVACLRDERGNWNEALIRGIFI